MLRLRNNMLLTTLGGGGRGHKDYVIIVCLEINSVLVWDIFHKLYLVQI